MSEAELELIMAFIHNSHQVDDGTSLGDVDEPDGDVKAEDWRIKGRMLNDIIKGLGMNRARIVQAMRSGEAKAAENIVHWKHADPLKTVYATRAHAVRHNLTGWHPGFDLREE